jgi:hypothetical protein
MNLGSNIYRLKYIAQICVGSNVFKFSPVKLEDSASTVQSSLRWSKDTELARVSTSMLLKAGSNYSQAFLLINLNRELFPSVVLPLQLDPKASLEKVKRLKFF